MTANIRKQKQPKYPHYPSDCEAGAPKKAVPFESPHKAYAKAKNRPPWGKEAGECLTEGGNSLSILDCFTTSPPNPTHHANKPHQIRGAIQYRKRAPPLRALTGPPLPKGRGLLYEPRLYLYRKQLLVATAKQEPEMSRPLWGKGDRVSGGRGELAYKYRLPSNQRTYPNNCRSNKPHYTWKAIQYRKRALPLRALTGPPLPKGRGLLYEPRKQNRTKPSFKQPIDLEVVVIVVVDCSIRGVGWRREFLLNHPLDFLKIQLAI